MVFGADDDPRERKIKLDVTQVYNHRVEVREKQKEFLEEHNLLDFKTRRVTRSRKKTQEVKGYIYIYIIYICMYA